MGKRKEFEDAFGPPPPDSLSRSELARALAGQVGLTLPYAEKVVRFIFDPDDGAIATTLVKGGRVSLYGFGTFSGQAVPARLVYSPRDKEKRTVSAHVRVRFTAGGPLESKLNQGA